MGLDLVMQIPGALFAFAGGYHHQVEYNVFAAGSPAATTTDPRILFWELTVSDEEVLRRITARLRTAATDIDETPQEAPSFVDEDDIRVVLRAERGAQTGSQHESSHDLTANCAFARRSPLRSLCCLSGLPLPVPAPLDALRVLVSLVWIAHIALDWLLGMELNSRLPAGDTPSEPLQLASAMILGGHPPRTL